MTHSLIAAGGRGFGRMHERGFHPILGLLCLVVLGALIGLGVWLALRRRPVGGHTAAAPMSSASASPTAGAETILAERLARGEIDTDDYRNRLDALRGVAVASAVSPPATTD